MKVNLLTDAPKHNLALMKISAYHKARGDSVFLNMPLMPADKTYASWLYEKSDRYPADIEGGPGVDPGARLPQEIEDMTPDYSLYPNIDYSLGYTWRACSRKCSFCKVGDMWQEKVHHSIWHFHKPGIKKICLLNNNTFLDPRWRETFEEVWASKLTVIEHGFDARLLNKEKATALKRTKFDGCIHFAWDSIKTEFEVLKGLELARSFKINALVYVLMGYDSTFEEDIYRCQKIHDIGFDPFPMLYKETDHLKAFRRMIYLRMYRKYKTIKEAWENYR